ncbi:MAG: phosphate/phosphite/phosphonate ABC transporter substrate-binding protein, partial [Rhodobacteraceae bacterium]
MNLTTKLSALTVAATLCIGMGVSQVMAEDCHRGTLDQAYCDRNMDQVADLPLDPNDWVDPSTLIFTYTPVEDPAVYANIWTPFIEHLESYVDRKVVF